MHDYIYTTKQYLLPSHLELRVMLNVQLEWLVKSWPVQQVKFLDCSRLLGD